MSRRVWLAAFAVLALAGVAPAAPGVVFDPAKSPRLVARTKQGLIVTTVRIDGAEHGPFLLDSGSFATTLDAQFAATLRLRPSTRPAGPGLHGKTIRFATVGRLDVGPVTFRDAEVAIVDLSAPATAFGERLAGVLGYPLFAAAVLEVDYPRQRIMCFDPRTYRLPRGEWQPLVLRGWQVGIAARFEHGVEGELMIDTGSNTPGVHFRAPLPGAASVARPS